MYVSIDYHKRYAVATSMDDKGQVVETVRLKNEPGDLIGFVDRLPEDSKIAIEATGNWYDFFELLEGKSPEIHLAHPLKTRAIAEARIKTDKIDSTILAHLLRTDLLPESYIPPREIRDIREVLRYRASLVSLRTALKNRIHAILSKNGIIVEYTDNLGKGAKTQLKALEVRSCYRLGIDGYIRLTETLQQLIDEVTKAIEGIVENNPQAKLLTTIHGIGYYSALLIVSEIGDITRFPNAKKLCSYAGLVPSVYSSGGKTRHGNITKLGSKWLRWILIELSQHFSKSYNRLERMYARIAYKHGKNTARVAVAREMLKIIYSMLTHNRPFVKE